MADNQTVQPIEVLLVEDNSGDVRLTEEALNEGSLLVHLNVARDGVEAMTFLHRKGKHQRATAERSAD